MILINKQKIKSFKFPGGAEKILYLLESLGYASSNVVFGIGSYTYQYVTRDTFGFAMKATFAKINGKGYPIFKDPATDKGDKKSAIGFLKVDEDYNLIQNVTEKEENEGLLETKFINGKIMNETTLHEIRNNINKNKGI